MLLLNPSWREYEEKESDVALGAAIVADGAMSPFNTAMIVSADGDMVPAIRELKSLAPSARDSRVPAKQGLRRAQEGVRRLHQIGEDKVRHAQLPDPVMAGSHSIPRPSHWS